MSISNLFFFFSVIFFSFIFFFFLIFFSFGNFFFFEKFLFDGALLDGTENENDDLSMPYSAPMRPSKIAIKPTADNTFNGAFGAFLNSYQETKHPTTAPKQPASKCEKTTATKPKIAREPKKPKQPKAAREPKMPKKSKIIQKPECTTIGLQIQIRDPIVESQPTPASSDTNFVSNAYSYSQNEKMPPNMISESMLQTSSPVSLPTNINPHTATYYNMDSNAQISLADDFIVYDPVPDPVSYHSQSIDVTSNECIDISRQMHNHSSMNHHHHPYNHQNHHRLDNVIPATNATPPNNSHHPYDIRMINYSDQKNSAALISHFNVSHTNVSNTSAVCDQVHSNWRAANEIMLNK